MGGWMVAGWWLGGDWLAGRWHWQLDGGWMGADRVPHALSLPSIHGPHGDSRRWMGRIAGRMVAPPPRLRLGSAAGARRTCKELFWEPFGTI